MNSKLQKWFLPVLPDDRANLSDFSWLVSAFEMMSMEILSKCNN